MDKEDLRTMLFQAAASPHGILLKASDPKRLRGIFYPLRQEEGLFELSYRIVESPEGNVQIERKQTGGERND